MPVTAAQITQTSQDHVDETTYGQPNPGADTKCNFFVRDVVESLLQQSRPELHGTANEIADALAAEPADWAATSLNVEPGGTTQIFADALDQVNNGRITIVAYRNPDGNQHGHIAIIIPSDQLYNSGTWGPVPYIAQAGPLHPGNKPGTEDQSVFARLELSYGFGIARRPDMTLYAYRGNSHLVNWGAALRERGKRSFTRRLASDNVDTGADDPTRVHQLWSLIGTVVSALGDTGNIDNKKRFMLHIAWHEGAKITARVQGGGGPARSFYQLERGKAIDAVNHARTNDWVGLLADAAGLGSDRTQAILDALDELNQDPSNPSFPNGNLIEEKLRTVDLFGSYMARIAVKRLPGAIGTSNLDHAQYWADNWKVVFESPEQKAQLIARFKDEADAVDQHL